MSRRHQGGLRKGSASGSEELEGVDVDPQIPGPLCTYFLHLSVNYKIIQMNGQ